MQAATYLTRSGSGSSGSIRRISADKASPVEELSAQQSLPATVRRKPALGAVWGGHRVTPPTINGGLESPHADGFGSLAPHQHCTESPECPGPGTAGGVRAIREGRIGSNRH